MSSTDISARRRIAAASLFAAPLLGLAASQLWPDAPADAPGRLTAIAAQADQFLVANVLTIGSIVLFVPAILLLARVTARRPVAHYLGGTLAVLGIVGWSGTTALSMADLALATTMEADAAAVAADRIAAGAGAGIFLALFLFGLFIGLVTLAVGAWRSGVAPAWVPAAVAVAVVLDVLASPNRIAVAVVWLLMTAALGWIGLRVLRSADRDSSAPDRGRVTYAAPGA